MAVLDPPKWMTSQEAASYLGIQEQTLAAWRCTKRHVIPFTRVGRLVRYRLPDLDKWITKASRSREDRT